MTIHQANISLTVMAANGRPQREVWMKVRALNVNTLRG